MTTLLLGAQGQLGFELAQQLPRLGPCLTSSRHDPDHACDAADRAQVNALLEATAPRTIVNAIAYTAVDRAESEPESAYRINRDLPGWLAHWCAKNQARLVHYSTDYVFDGSATRPYREDDPTGPLGVYGDSKLAGERAITESGCNHLILRTAWVYGRQGHNFVKTIGRLALERDELNIVDDQWGTPTSAAALALMTRQILSDHLALAGVFHLSSTGDPVTWLGFARYFVEKLAEEGRPVARLNPITTQDYPTPAARPLWSVLDNRKIINAANLQVPDWRRQLDRAWPALRKAVIKEKTNSR